MKRNVAVLLFVLLASSEQALLADDLNQTFNKVNQFVAAKNFPKALEELAWARTEIEKMHNAQLQTFFPDNLTGFTGQKVETSNVLGMSNLERNYVRGKDSVKVTLVGGTGSASAGLGNLAALGRMAAMFGGQGTGVETIRVGGRTASLQSGQNGESPKLTIYLDSGSMLELELTQGKDVELLKAMANAINIDALDTYLRGSK